MPGSLHLVLTYPDAEIALQNLLMAQIRNSPSFYSSPPITTFDHTQISLLPVPKFQPARAGVLKVLAYRISVISVQLLNV